MGYIRLTSVGFTPTPVGSSKLVTVKHKLAAAPDAPENWTTDSAAVLADINGVFSAPFYITGLTDGVPYTVRTLPNCGGGGFDREFTTSCGCPTGFAPSADNTRCEKTETMAPVITHSNYCLAPSRNNVYNQFKSRIYNVGISPSLLSGDIQLDNPPADHVFATMTLAPQWANPTSNISLGVVNREAVWIDSDCDGTKNALTAGEQTTLAVTINNITTERTVYVGCAADNQFILEVNGELIAQTTSAGSDRNFKIFHIFPVTLRTGENLFNITATGDGSVNDAVAMVIYDNIPQAIRDASSDADLTILFKSSDLIGQHIDIATCTGVGYSLDTSGGQGNYICKKVTIVPCGTP